MKKIAYTGLAFLTPVLVFAQAERARIDSLQDVAAFVIAVINTILVPLVFALAFIVFIWGVFMYFIKGGAEPEREKAKSLMLYGIIGFFVMVSVWGLVRILTGTVNLNNANPTVNGELPSAPNINQ